MYYWHELLCTRLAGTMDALADVAASRDPERVPTVVLGRAGVGGSYDQWRRLRAWARGRSFDPAHGEDRR